MTTADQEPDEVAVDVHRVLAPYGPARIAVAALGQIAVPLLVLLLLVSSDWLLLESELLDDDCELVELLD